MQIALQYIIFFFYLQQGKVVKYIISIFLILHYFQCNVKNTSDSLEHD